MKRNARVVGDDGRVYVEVTVRVQTGSDSKLAREEVDEIARHAIRKIAYVMSTLPYCDLGVERLRVEV